MRKREIADERNESIAKGNVTARDNVTFRAFAGDMREEVQRQSLARDSDSKFVKRKQCVKASFCVRCNVRL